MTKLSSNSIYNLSHHIPSDINTIPSSQTNLNSENNMTKETINIGGRSSKLAVVQSIYVKHLIEQFTQNQYLCNIISRKTLGDHVQFKPLYSFGGKSLWTKELEDLLYCGMESNINNEYCLDMIVHSLKDMPTNLPDGFELGCIVKREDPTDCLVFAQGSSYKTLEDLPNDANIGTSSIRRSAQLKRMFPNWKFKNIRGNIQTRLNKLDSPSTSEDGRPEFDAIVLASAGLIRLNLQDRISQRLNTYHAVGQGALGIEIRQNDTKISSILNQIENIEATVCCLAERALLRTMEGGCSVPIGVTSLYRDNKLTLNCIVIDCDGVEFVEDSMTVEIVDIHQDSMKCGQDLAYRMIQNGAGEILESINASKYL
ncbi:porphobilinogen deaminase [Monosporozyma unispora]|nr:porphobilinogen deaminase [Kazachstania unispora]